MDTPAPDEEPDRLRAELAEWRRRAEVAEAVSAERLTRAETAEAALDVMRAALRRTALPATGTPAAGRPDPAGTGVAEPYEGQAEPAPPPARSLRERWRRYIDSVN